MSLMTKMYTYYKKDWEKIKKEVELFIKTWKAKNLTDEVSLGIIKNLEE